MAFKDIQDSPGALIIVDERGRTNLTKAGARGGSFVGHRHADGTITLTPTTPAPGDSPRTREEIDMDRI